MKANEEKCKRCNGRGVKIVDDDNICCECWGTGCSVPNEKVNPTPPKPDEEKMREKIARIVYENGCPDQECDRHETRTCKQCTEETADKILALLKPDEKKG
jgi:hypothetical protein